MKLIKLKSKPNDEDWTQRFVEENDYDTLFDEDVTITKPDGQPLLVLLKKSLSTESVGKAWGILRGLNMKTENRFISAGTTAHFRKKKDGTTTKTNRVRPGWAVYSGIIGYFERNVRFPYCRSCSWNLRNPEKFAKLFPMVKEVNELFAKHIPDRYAVQKSFVDKTHPDFVIPGTVYTTLTVNKNFRTACHKDAGDLAAGFSCMSLIRRGQYKGGNLVLPNWRVACKLDTYDLVMFDAHEFHGNTQILPLSEDAQRCSIVYYYRESMVHCKSQLEELEFAKNRKRGEPLF